MADYPDYYSYLGQGDYPSSGGGYGGGYDYSQLVNPEQTQSSYQGFQMPTNLTAINQMAGGGSGGTTMPTTWNPMTVNYGVGPDANIGNTPQTVTAGAGSGGGGTQPNFANRMMSSFRNNPMAALAMLGAGGTGLAGLITGNQSPTLPSQVQQALRTAQTGTGGPQNPNAQYNYDLARAQQARKLAAEMGPGYATSTPGIQAQQELERTINQDIYQRQLGQQQVGLSTVNALTQPLIQRQAQSQQNLFGLTGLLGTLGYLGMQGNRNNQNQNNQGQGSSWFS